MISNLEWHFGGWLQSLPKPLAWGALGGTALIGLAFIIFSYGRTLRELPPPRRWALTAFRVLMLLAVLLCLANPGRVDRAPDQGKGKRVLAVLIDRSGSMNAKDNRSETRLGNAVRLWKQHADEIHQGFDGVDYYRFSTKVAKASNLEDALQAQDPGAETHLYEALNQMLEQSPGGIVCLTDGLDTTGRQADELIARAQQQGVPLYFVAGSNRTRPAEMLGIREITMPSQVLRHSQFTAGVALEIASPREQEVPVELWNKDQKLASTTLKVHAGWSVLPWSVPVSAKEPGPMQLEFRAGVGERQEVAAATTQVVDKKTVEVLYYQGALQWGYRYLLTALQSDPSFRMTAILNPALNMQLTSSAPDGQAMNDLPEAAAALKRFQIVILANVFADQLSTKQQSALVDYVKGGGAVLFIAPDSAASVRFSGTELEKMLPVVFAPPQAPKKEGQAEAQFQQTLAGMNGADNGMDTEFAAQTLDEQSQSQAPKLYPFTAPPGAAARVSRLFQPGPDAPKFEEYAKVNNVKPGAEVLAVHPSDRVPGTGAPRVLVARQQFGQGSSAVLTTDLLWRWKMSLPSGSHLVETFWQQFMMLLAGTTTGQGLRLVKADAPAAAGQPVMVRVEGTEGGAPVLVSVSPAGAKKTLVFEPVAGGAGGKVSFTPDAAGRWEVSANDPAGNFARITMPVSALSRTVESADVPADVEGLRRLSEATGGGLIDNTSATIRSRPAAGLSFAMKVPQPLWDTRWLIAILLGIYGVELVTRRVARLL